MPDLGLTHVVDGGGLSELVEAGAPVRPPTWPGTACDPVGQDCPRHHLELLFPCAPPNLFRSESDVLSRRDIGTNDGRRQVNGLCARYDLNRREAASGRRAHIGRIEHLVVGCILDEGTCATGRQVPEAM